MASVETNGNGVWLELSRKNTTWEKYGLFDAPIKLIGPDGVRYQSKSYKAVLRGKEKPTLAAIVGSRYQLYPNQEALRIVEEAGWKPKKVYYSKDYNSMWAQYESPDLEFEVTVGDVVRIGFMLRNSIDGSVGFGADVFTMRLKCSNGSIAVGEELVSFSRKHTGEMQDEVTKNLSRALEQVVQSAEEIIGYYKSWNEIETNQNLLDALSETIIPRKYAPKYIDIRKADSHMILPKMQHIPRVWNTYNDFTQNIWHTDKTSMRSKVTYLTQLNKTIIAEVVI